MADDASSFPEPLPPRTTGGNWRWEPPAAAALQTVMRGYTVEKLLGCGGMGAVYRGIQTNLDRPVAIKILPPGVEREDPGFAERFKSEARLMAKLNHPAVVGVYDFGTTLEGQLYFAMEYVDGSDVAQMLSAQGRLPPAYALAITAYVCDALQAAHELGIVHRDIKPANVLLNVKGQVKVADFGLAKAEDPGQRGITKTGFAMGTPDFVAPEALMGGTHVDGRADIYAVGVMLYQMLTGNIPRGAFKPAFLLVPGLDPRFDPIITRAMQHDRAERYQSAAELRRDLDVIMTVPLAEQNATTPAAVPAREMLQVPGQRSAAHQPAPPAAGVPPGTVQPAPGRGPAGAAAKQSGGEGDRQAPAKSRMPIFLGLGTAAAIAIGAIVTFSGEKKGAKTQDLVAATRSTQSDSAAPSPASSAKPLPLAKNNPAPEVAASSNFGTRPFLQKFPSGEWVKVFTSFDQLPAHLRKPGSGVRLSYGKLEVDSMSVHLSLSPRPEPFRNCLVRVKMSAAEFRLRLRDSNETYYTFQAASIQAHPPQPHLASFSSPSKGEHEWEFAAVGNLLVARRDGKLIGSATHDAFKSGRILLANFKGTLRDFEVMNLDGLSEAEALKLVGVDDKGNDLRGAIGKAPVPVAESAATLFPPGKWVKVFSQFTDLPESMRKPGSGVTFEDGWIVAAAAKPFYLTLGPSGAKRNWGWRARFKRGAAFEMRVRETTAGGEQFYVNTGHTMAHLARIDGTLKWSPFAEAGAKTTKPDNHVTFAAVGPCLVGRRDEEPVLFARDDQIAEGRLGLVNLKGAVREIEVINLEGLPEAAALRLLGVDEKGNNLHALAAPPEVQKAQPAPPVKAAEAAPAVAELRALHEQFEKLRAERVTGPFVAEVAKLNASYLGGIDREITSEKKAGHLDGILALEQEKMRIADKQPIPAGDGAAIPAALKKLRGIYREALARIDAVRATNWKALADPLDLRLKQLESTLTQQDRVSDAKTVREYREKLSSANPGAGTTGAAITMQTGPEPPRAETPPQPAGAPKRPAGDDRKAAEWVLGLGGSVTVKDGGKVMTFGTKDRGLPAGKFDLTEIRLEFSSDDPKRPQAIEDLLPLAGLQQLGFLYIRNFPIKDEHLSILGSLPALKGVELLVDNGTGELTDGIFEHLSAATSLTSLGLRNQPKVEGAKAGLLKDLKQLKRLSLHLCKLSDEGFAALGQLEQLQDLQLPYTGMTDAHLPALKNFNKLTTLSVRITSVSAPALAGMRNLETVTRLGVDFTGGRAPEEAAVLAKAMPKVASWNFEQPKGAPYTASDIRGMAAFPDLATIECFDDRFNDAAAAGFLGLPKLKVIALSRAAITDAALIALASHKSLGTINLRNLDAVTDEGLAALADLKSLRNLDIAECPGISAEGVAAFKKRRPDVTAAIR